MVPAFQVGKLRLREVSHLPEGPGCRPRSVATIALLRASLCTIHVNRKSVPTKGQPAPPETNKEAFQFRNFLEILAIEA